MKEMHCDICVNRIYIGEDLLCSLGKNKNKPKFKLPSGPNADDYGWKAKCTDFNLEYGADLVTLKNIIKKAVSLMDVGKVYEAKELLSSNVK